MNLAPSLRLVSSLLALAAALTAQQGSFTTFGAGCNGSGLTVPRIGNVGTPRVGAAFVINYTGPNEIQPGIGLTDQPILIASGVRVDLPVPVFDPVQPANCVLYPSLDALIPMAPDRSGTMFESQLTLNVPNLPALIGASAFFQWMTPHIQCYFVGCGLGWIAFSDGAQAVIGV